MILFRQTYILQTIILDAFRNDNSVPDPDQDVNTTVSLDISNAYGQ